MEKLGFGPNHRLKVKVSARNIAIARDPAVILIDERLQRDDARPIIYHNTAATCWRPELKGLTTMVNSIYNGWRMEDMWLDR